MKESIVGDLKKFMSGKAEMAMLSKVNRLEFRQKRLDCEDVEKSKIEKKEPVGVCQQRRKGRTSKTVENADVGKCQGTMRGERMHSMTR